MRTHHPRPIVGQRKAELFNQRFPLGGLVAVRRTPGEPATWDRVFAPAYGAGDCAMVELASSLIPVDTDLVFACPPELVEPTPVVATLSTTAEQTIKWRHSFYQILAFILGAAAAVLLALAVPPAPAAVSDATGADCDIPASAQEGSA